MALSKAVTKEKKKCNDLLSVNIFGHVLRLLGCKSWCCVFKCKRQWRTLRRAIYAEHAVCADVALGETQLHNNVNYGDDNDR